MTSSLPTHRRGPAEAAGPVAVADDGHRMLTERPVVAGAEQAADLRALAQHAEAFARDELHAARFRLRRRAAGAAGRAPASLGCCSGRTTRRGRRACSRAASNERVREARFHVGAAPGHLREIELCGLCDRQRAQHDRVDQREDRAGRANPDGQRQDGHSGEDRTTHEQAAAEAQVLEKVFDRLEVCACRGKLPSPDRSHQSAVAPADDAHRFGADAPRDLVGLHLLEVKRSSSSSSRSTVSTPDERSQRQEDAMMEAVVQAWRLDRVDSGCDRAGESRRHCSASRSSWCRPARVSE